jgi:hypothetical protein
MIRTRYARPITIIGQTDDSSWVVVRYEDGSEREVNISDLRADGGVKEIMDAIVNLRNGD